MKKQACAALIVLISCAWFPLARAAAPNLGREASALNQQSKIRLGVSIRALALLFDAQPGGYLLKYKLIQDGSWPYLQELQRASLVNVTTKSGVAYTAASTHAWLSHTLTSKGKQVRDALSEP